MSRIQNLQTIKTILILLSIVIGGIFLCGWKPIEILNAITTRKGYAVFYDKAYGENTRQKLDIYVPNSLAFPRSTIVFFYGGSWQFGDKNLYRFLGQAFASQGFITVVVNYRLYPEVYFPAFMQDGAKAVHWIHNNIHKFGGSSDHVFLAGHSAGAHIAALLGTNDQYLKAEGGTISWIKGVIGISGPYDFLPFTSLNVKKLFSKVQDSQTQPINYVKSGLPPFLLVTGNGDKTVLPKNTINFANRLRSFKVPVTEIIYPKIGHIEIIMSLSKVFRYKDPLLNDISHFIDAINKKSRGKK